MYMVVPTYALGSAVKVCQAKFNVCISVAGSRFPRNGPSSPPLDELLAGQGVHAALPVKSSRARRERMTRCPPQNQFPLGRAWLRRCRPGKSSQQGTECRLSCRVPRTCRPRRDGSCRRWVGCLRSSWRTSCCSPAAGWQLVGARLLYELPYEGGARLRQEQPQEARLRHSARLHTTAFKIGKKGTLTAGAVDQRVVRAAEEAGQAGDCDVTQQAVRPLNRAPLCGHASTPDLGLLATT